MTRLGILAALLVGGLTLLLFLGLGRDAGPPPRPAPAPAAEARPAARLLPGLREDGFVQLPNGWRLKPSGKQLELGDFPVQIAVHPSGQFLAILHAGLREHEVVIVELGKTRQRIANRFVLDQAFYGLSWSPDGKQLYASGGEYEVVHALDFARGVLSNPRQFRVAEKDEKFIVGGLAVSADGRDLFACGTWADAVARIPVDNPDNLVRIPLTPGKGDPAPKGPAGAPPSPPDGRKENDPADPTKPAASDKPLPGNPYACLLDPKGKRLFVSLWSKAAVAVVDLDANRVTDLWPTAAHPTEMVLTPDGKSLYVACANSTQVSVLDAQNGTARQTIGAALYPNAPVGNTPNSLAITPDGEFLFVANADSNNLAVFNVSDPGRAKPLGFIPTGWYPTSVRYNATDKKVYVTDGKGQSSKPNRSGPNPLRPGAPASLSEYIGGLFRGTLTTLDLPTPESLAKDTETAFQCSPLKRDLSPTVEGELPANHPIPKKQGDPSPIQHVIYVIKENRTYDQVFGDVPEGNGEARLCLFPEAITPNHHALAKQFVLLDNIYAEGEVSADGHEWSMGAYATDYVEKSWPLSYRGSPFKKFGYPSEGAQDREARPAGGYLWDVAAKHKKTYRSYGEWVNNGKTPADPAKAAVPALEGHFDPKYRSYDLEYPDVKRADRFIEELKEFEKKGEYPQLTIVKLPNDHTAGTRVGKPTPTAMVADNDLALGRIVEAVSQSKFWKDTAIFVIEDDAQNGPDHVDAHRVVALVISPYTKHGAVDSNLYSTSSMLRTMELILGLPPMSQFDAAARPMYGSFQPEPDATPYKHRVPRTDLDAKNVAGAWGAEWSETAELDEHEDRADDIRFNEVIWRSVKGADAPMPAPVRAAFFRPKE